jgi:hypothetical protein
MTYEEKFDAVQAFCDKYKTLIDEATEGSDLWAFRELCDSFDEIDKVQTAIWMDTIGSVKVRLINAMLHIAERWSNETDIELSCVDPATGEETIISGTPSEEHSRTFVNLETMPLDRVNADGQFVHATGYAIVDADGGLSYCYEDSQFKEPGLNDTVLSEREWRALVYGTDDTKED